MVFWRIFAGSKMESASVNIQRLSEFVVEHYGDDPSRLVLQKDKWPGIDVGAAASTLLCRRKLSSKAPLWATEPGLVMPLTLSAEQCSSAVTARHKADFIAEIFKRNRLSGSRSEAAEGPRVADLTGGLGVDSLEFSRIAEKVFYNEMNPLLSEAARHNFGVLGAWNIDVHSFETSMESLKVEGGNLGSLLEKFHPDVIFLDPARRDGCGNKVFLLEDCSPDILEIEQRLLEIAPSVVLKLSPMADVSMVVKRLGERRCREVQIIEAGGECKELLVKLGREDVKASGKRPCVVKAFNLDCDDEPLLEYEFALKAAEGAGNGSCCRLAGENEIESGAVLFEPGKALMKAGCFDLIGEKLGAAMLGHDTHYYIMDNGSLSLNADNVSDSLNAGNGSNSLNMSGEAISLTDGGKLFRILEVAPLSGKTIKAFGKTHPEAEVSARGVRMTSEELRKRMGCRPSERFHIFALHSDSQNGNLLLFTERIFPGSSEAKTFTDDAVKADEQK